MSCWGHGHATERPWWISPSCRCTPKARWLVDLGWWLVPKRSVAKTNGGMINFYELGTPFITNSWSLDWFYKRILKETIFFYRWKYVGFLWILSLQPVLFFFVLPNPTWYANFHLRLAVWGLLKSCKNSRSTIGFTAWFMRKWGFHCGSCGLSQEYMGRKSKPGHDGNSQVPKWFASHTTDF